MCMQCCTDAVVYATKDDREVLPGWYLTQAQKDYFDDWKTGEWGLVQCNDPDFIWAGKLFEQHEGPNDDGEPWGEYDESLSNLVCSLEYGSMYAHLAIYAAAKSAGFKEKEEGFFNIYEFATWLMDRLAKWVKTHPVWKSDEK